jgi:uncharacterized membrane protein
MRCKKTFFITSLVSLSPILIGLALWGKLPDTIATHFDINGVADGYSSKAFRVFGLPLIMFFTLVFCYVITMVSPKKEKISDKILSLVLWIMPIMSLVISINTYMRAFGINININSVMLVLMGVLFAVLGNYMPKFKQNYVMGIRLPWTLDSEDNWYATHRFAGKIWTLGGLVFLIGGIVSIFKKLGGMTVFVLLMGGILVLSFAPVIYSLSFYLKHDKKS